MNGQQCSIMALVAEALPSDALEEEPGAGLVEGKEA